MGYLGKGWYRLRELLRKGEYGRDPQFPVATSVPSPSGSVPGAAAPFRPLFNDFGPPSMGYVQVRRGAGAAEAGRGGGGGPQPLRPCVCPCSRRP